jgi:GT2 family glycosyltransferase
LANISSPKIAAIVVNCNGGKLLSRCIESLLRQTRRPDVIALVDNASNDGSAESVQEQYPEIEVIRLRENLGFAGANNLAIARLPECEWIAFLNPDAFPEPEWLEKLLSSAQACPSYTFYASRMLSNGDRTTLDGAGDVYHTSGAAWRLGHGRKCEISDLQKAEVFGACAAAALYRRDAILASGGFDEKYFCYFEDVDLAFRLRLAGHRCLYVPDAERFHDLPRSA